MNSRFPTHTRCRRLETFCATLLVFLCFADAPALDPQKTLTQYGRASWQVEDGLPVGAVSSIVQTRNGYLWMSTSEGVVRFDGVRFTVFDRRNTPALKDIAVNVLREDRAGNLWIGTHGGLTRYRDGRFQTFTTDDGLPDDNVFALLEDRAGDLLVGTFAGLCRLRGGVFKPSAPGEGLPRSSVFAILEDRAGDLWVGTGGGLYRSRGGRFFPEGIGTGVAAGRRGTPSVFALAEDRSGALWVGTSGGLSKFDEGGFTNFTTRDGLSSNLVRPVHEDSRGCLWFGTTSMCGGALKTYTVRDGLSHNDVVSIHEDAAGVLWFGTYGGGLNRYADGEFVSFTVADGLPEDVAYAILEDARGDLWVSGQRGIFRVGKAALNEKAAGKIDRQKTERDLVMEVPSEHLAARPVMTDLVSGLLGGEEVVRVTKTIGDLAGYWHDAAAFARLDPATPLYTTESWLPAGEQTAGALAWGNTTLLPGRVGREYFMTRGHWHRRRECGELVICVEGEGALILMNEERQTRVERLTPGSTHHVPGYTAHRTANTGDRALRFLCAWEANCGHDYEEICRSGFSGVLLDMKGSPQLTPPG